MQNKIVQRPIGALILTLLNSARTNRDKQIAQLAASHQKIGFHRPGADRRRERRHLVRYFGGSKISTILALPLLVTESLCRTVIVFIIGERSNKKATSDGSWIKPQHRPRIQLSC
jgi:hypothetical protein